MAQTVDAILGHDLPIGESLGATFPEAKSSAEPPEEGALLERAIRRYVQAWADLNLPGAPVRSLPRASSVPAADTDLALLRLESLKKAADAVGAAIEGGAAGDLPDFVTTRIVVALRAVGEAAQAVTPIDESTRVLLSTLQAALSYVHGPTEVRFVHGCVFSVGGKERTAWDLLREVADVMEHG